MNGRDRLLAIIIGSVLGLVVAYEVVDGVFLGPLEGASKTIETAEEALGKHQREIDRGRKLRLAWRDMVGRSISQDASVVLDRFGQDLKQRAGKHHLDKTSFNGRGSGKIGRSKKAPITTVSYSVAGQGAYGDVMAFLRDLYATPYLCRITKLSISPINPKVGPNLVKIDQLVIETPVFPQFDKKTLLAIKLPNTMKSMDRMDAPLTDLGRGEVVSGEAWARLDDRNIFKLYVPPPKQLVAIDNQDWRDVVVRLRPFWEGKPFGEQPILTVGGKSKKDAPTFEGDAVEITAIYADAEAFGPRRFDSKTRPPWVLHVPVHSPAPPPEQIDLAVDNQDDDVVDVVVVVTDGGGKSVTKPTMRIPAGKRIDIDVYEKVKTVVVTATYASGKPAGSRTFMPAKTKQVFPIGVEGEAPPEVVVAPPEVVADPPADASLTVTGMWTAPDVHVLIAVNGRTHERMLIATGQDVDGGALMAVHPFGGVVYMAQTGHYYLYPFEEPFTSRVLLEGLETEATQVEVGAAIERWVRGDDVVRSQ